MGRWSQNTDLSPTSGNSTPRHCEAGAFLFGPRSAAALRSRAPLCGSYFVSLNPLWNSNAGARTFAPATNFELYNDFTFCCFLRIGSILATLTPHSRLRSRLAGQRQQPLFPAVLRLAPVGGRADNRDRPLMREEIGANRCRASAL